MEELVEIIKRNPIEKLPTHVLIAISGSSLDLTRLQKLVGDELDRRYEDVGNSISFPGGTSIGV